MRRLWRRFWAWRHYRRVREAAIVALGDDWTAGYLVDKMIDLCKRDGSSYEAALAAMIDDKAKARNDWRVNQYLSRLEG